MEVGTVSQRPHDTHAPAGSHPLNTSPIYGTALQCSIAIQYHGWKRDTTGTRIQVFMLFIHRSTLVDLPTTSMNTVDLPGTAVLASCTRS